METLNIPLSLLAQYKTKERKEILAFSICIKCRYSNSVLLDVSPKKVMAEFHVAHGKAKRLIEGAKNSPLFSYSEELNQLTAITYKDRSVKRAKNGMSYSSDYCYKLEKKPYSIGEMTKLISEILIENAINAVERDNLNQRGNSCCGSDKSLTQKKLGNIAGISRSSAQRLTKRLADRGIISKTRAVAKMVISRVNEFTVSEWRRLTGLKRFILNPKDGSGWIVKPCSYSILNRSVTDSFQHVIYDHKARISAVNVSQDDPFARMAIAL